LNLCIEKEIELAGLKLNLTPKNIIILGVYRSPAGQIDSFLNHLSKAINFLMSKINLPIIICGDFNINLLKESKEKLSFLNTLESFGLKQKITSVTRESYRGGTLIDNVFTNISPAELHSSVIITALSDHHGQMTVLKHHKPNVSKTKYIYKRIIEERKIQHFKTLLQRESWNSIFSENLSMDDKYHIFNDTLTSLFEESFPITKKRIIHRTENNIQLSEETLMLKKQVKTLYRQTKHLNLSDTQRRMYVKKKKEYRQGILKDKSNFVQDQLKNNKNNSKEIWKIINKNQKEIPEDSNLDKLVQNYKSGIKLANDFNKYYVNIGQNDDPQNSTGDFNQTFPVFKNSFFLTPTTEIEILKIIKNLKLSHSSGFDGMSSNLIKRCCFELISPLTHLVNTSISTGSFPTILKTSKIIPIYKKGEFYELSNYRPISILSTFSKIFEKVIFEKFLNYIEKHKILSNYQFGFRRNLSTTHAMFNLISNIVSNLDGNKKVMTLFLDLEKAFDQVSHKRLLHKLENYGIRGVSQDWFRSYLLNRKQTVEISYTDITGCLKKIYSEELNTKSGVPQGSILGPLLFIIYLNDINTKKFQPSKMTLFADDTSLTVSDVNYINLEKQAFSSSNILIQWFADNGFKINVSKTSYISFSINNNNSYNLTLQLDTEYIKPCSSIKYLGVIFDEHLKFKEHVNMISRKIAKYLYLLRFLSSFCSTDILLMAYHSFIISNITYAIPIWGQSSKTISLFKLQKKALRIIFKKSKRQSCRKIFSKNSLLTLPSIYIFETILFVKNNLNSFDVSRNSKLPYNIRQSTIIQIPHHNKTFFEKHTMYNGTKLMNKLPKELQEETNINLFRRKLKNILIKNTYYSISEFMTSLN
jgi:hypothetical protein